jgi:HTH-type transcriptional regulator/antitoxin MqsA
MLGLSQVQAGSLIGGGPRAFQKYEAGDLVPSRTANTALILLDNDPSALRQVELRYASREDPAPDHTA